jgi:hypothetical protein
MATVEDTSPLSLNRINGTALDDAFAVLVDELDSVRPSDLNSSPTRCPDNLRIRFDKKEGGVTLLPVTALSSTALLKKRRCVGHILIIARG